MHGLITYSNTAAHVAKELAKSGIIVAAFDYRGMGKSEGIKGWIESSE